MHLLIVHQNFVDHRHPGGTRHFELARQLVRLGHQCTIVAGSVDFLTGRPLSRKPQTIDGVRIRRAYAFPTIHHSYVGRALSYLCFMVTSVWVALRSGRVDAVLATSPPMFQLPSAWLVAVLRNRPLILEIRDLWPEFAIEMGVIRNRFMIQLARAIERFFYRHQDWVVANSPGFVDYLLQHGVPKRRLTVIPNGVETAMFDPLARGQSIRRDLHLADKVVVTYAGSLGQANDIDTLLRAAVRLADNDQIRFLMVGGGKELPRLQSFVEAQGLRNVIFGGHFPKEQIREVLAASDVCVAILQDQPMFRTVYPNKVFDYMAAGRPTILLIDGVIREVIESAEGGSFVPPGDDLQLANMIRRYASDPDLRARQGQQARRYVVQHFQRADQARQLEHVLEQVVATQPQRTCYRRWLKRPLDLVFALGVATLLLPVILVTAMLVRWKLGAPVLFRQPRLGWRDRPFTVFKFRSMRDATDEQGQPLPDEQRLTEFGKRLRALSLDELPQLWNIIRGDMSLIGPRPLLVRYADRYSPEQARRHDVRPGITGWAQINGRNSIDWDEKFRLDVWYVDHGALWVDLKILFQTIACVLSRKGISSGEHATMPEFMGAGEDSPELDQTVCTTSDGSPQ